MSTSTNPWEELRKKRQPKIDTVENNNDIAPTSADTVRILLLCWM